MRAAILRSVWVLLLLGGVVGRSPGQNAGGPALTLETDAVAPARFVAAHGERALLMGYSGGGLEAWGYPFQLFRDYRVSFLPEGAVEAIDGASLLRRIEYRPEEVVRIYVGPDFEVREHLFVPVDRPGVIIRYEVLGRHAVDVKISFVPVLNLMWPGAIGGQDLNWDAALSGYVIAERTAGYRAVLASPEQAGHSEPVNSTLRQNLAQSMVLHPAHGQASFFAVLEENSAAEGSGLRALEQGQGSLLAAAQAHAQTVLQSGMQIGVPDEAVNRALAWSRLALDQAWVCDDRLGCGMVAGYGPSRGIRRPQYAWFFGGDGLIAAEALLAEGDTERARQELEFILRYQNHANGMIWHELSQSAGFIDWAGKYPYMYVHVDITFAFLSTLADYYETTGDVGFLREHWKEIGAAYDYCRALIDPQTKLPRIPANKEGGNEQERMSEDVGLSAAWVSASDAYRRLSDATGHASEAAAAEEAGTAARKALSSRYWDATKHFWIAGYSENGTAMTDERTHPGLLGQGLFTPEQESAALERIASAAFQTDWGTRGMSAQSSHYNPDSYASGSVSALGTAETAEAFWRDHEPATAESIWESLLPWLQLDSLGHLHEVAAGDFFHAQVESVPEQTWSSAGLVSSLVHGWFGVEADAPDHRLGLAPHLDPRWNKVSLGHMAVGPAHVSAEMQQKAGELDASFSAQGGPVHVSFAPEIPLGAAHVRALVDGREIPVHVEEHAEDEHARVEIDVAERPVRCRIVYAGGVAVVAPASSPMIGEPSHELKLTGLNLREKQLTVEADVENAAQASVQMRTSWKVDNVEGGTVVPLGDDWYKVSLADAPPQNNAGFVHRRITIRFAIR